MSEYNHIYYKKWYEANKNRKIQQVRKYREEAKDTIKIKAHLAYLKRKGEGYYDK